MLATFAFEYNDWSGTNTLNRKNISRCAFDSFSWRRKTPGWTSASQNRVYSEFSVALDELFPMTKNVFFLQLTVYLEAVVRFPYYCRENFVNPPSFVGLIMRKQSWFFFCQIERNTSAWFAIFDWILNRRKFFSVNKNIQGLIFRLLLKIFQQCAYALMSPENPFDLDWN